jgi:carbamoyl-phosphate synthase large subunit
VEVARKFTRLGLNIEVTRGTRAVLADNGVDSDLILKLQEGLPNIDDAIKNKEIQLLINTFIGKASQYDDSYIQKAAIMFQVP